MSSEPVAIRAWDELVAACVVGTARSGGRVPSLCDAPANILARLPNTHNANAPPHAENSDAPLALLRAASLLSTYERAGRRPAPATAQPVPICEDADQRCCSPNAAAHLAKILYEGFDDLLGEWCEAARRRGLVVTHEFVIELLNRAQAAPPESAARIRAVAGKRGAWVESLRSAAPATTPLERWKNGSMAERAWALRELRRSDANAARALLQAGWEQEPPDERAALIAALELGLSSADELFLEAALDDRRKATRLAAAELLASIPASALSQRMATRAADCVSIKLTKRTARSAVARIDVTLPNKPDAATRRDGVEFRSVGQMGERASALSQFVAFAPLELWERSGASAAELVAAARSSEWSEPLLKGGASAARRARAAAWLEPLLADALSDEALDAKALLRALDAAARERVMTRALPATKPPSESVLEALDACEHAWSISFSRSVLVALQRYCGSQLGNASQALRSVLCKRVPLCLAPELAAEAQHGWNRNSPFWNYGDDMLVNALQTTLALRCDMLKELNA